MQMVPVLGFFPSQTQKHSLEIILCVCVCVCVCVCECEWCSQKLAAIGPSSETLQPAHSLSNIHFNIATLLPKNFLP